MMLYICCKSDVLQLRGARRFWSLCPKTYITGILFWHKSISRFFLLAHSNFLSFPPFLSLQPFYILATFCSSYPFWNLSVVGLTGHFSTTKTDSCMDRSILALLSAYKSRTSGDVLGIDDVTSGLQSMTPQQT